MSQHRMITQVAGVGLFVRVCSKYCNYKILHMTYQYYYTGGSSTWTVRLFANVSSK